MFTDGLKTISPEKLISLVAELPKDSLIVANRVGNLLVIDSYLKATAYIDFAEESLELFVEGPRDDQRRDDQRR